MSRFAGCLAERVAKDGFDFPHRAFSAEEASELLEEYTTSGILANRHVFLNAVYSVFKPHLIWLWADRIAHHSEILDVVEQVLGPDILVWSMDVFRRDPVKDLSTATHIPERCDQIAAMGLNWHQDSPYIGLEPLNRVFRVWLALTIVNEENGTMRYLRGSHRSGTLPHEECVEIDDRNRGPKVKLDVSSSDVVPVVLEPGYFSLHDIRTVHDSGPNLTDSVRVAVSITYVSADIRCSQRCSLMPARGRMPDTFDLEERPVRNLDSTSLSAFIDALQFRVQHMRTEGVPVLREKD